MTKRVPKLFTALAFVAICFLASGIGQLFTGGEPDGWYRELRKPAFTPPDWIFGPVWTLLYILMGVAAWLVWLRRGNRTVIVALVLFAIQLALNAAWPGLFFGLHNPRLAFAEIVVLWLAIVLTLWTFFRVSKVSGWLMVPYLGWVTFAAVLNMAIWRLNA
jgi:tryptophan-rich sensory protein